MQECVFDCGVATWDIVVLHTVEWCREHTLCGDIGDRKGGGFGGTRFVWGDGWSGRVLVGAVCGVWLGDVGVDGQLAFAAQRQLFHDFQECAQTEFVVAFAVDGVYLVILVYGHPEEHLHGQHMVVTELAHEDVVQRTHNHLRAVETQVHIDQ